MEINEIIGFIIVLFIMLFPILRKLLGKKPVQEEDEEQKPSIKKKQSLPFPAPLQAHPKPRESRPITQRKVDEDFSFYTQIQDRKGPVSIEERKLKQWKETDFNEDVTSEAFDEKFFKKTKKKQRHLEAILRKKTSGQKMVIYSEIFKRINDS